VALLIAAVIFILAGPSVDAPPSTQVKLQPDYGSMHLDVIGSHLHRSERILGESRHWFDMPCQRQPPVMRPPNLSIRNALD
jgi:hypothetical protein